MAGTAPPPSPAGQVQVQGDGFDILRHHFHLLSSTVLSAHSQHLTIRLSRQLQLLTSSAPSSEREENFIRLISRLQELETGLGEEEVKAVEGGEGEDVVLGWRKAVAATERIRKDLEEAKKVVNEQQRGHKKSESAISIEELRRKAPPSSSNSNVTTDLQSFLSTTSSSSFPHSQSLSDAYALRLLALEPARILPPGKSLSSIFRSPPSPPAPSESLEDRLKASLERAYFDEFVTSLPSRDSWTRLRKDLWDAASSLIPSQMDGGKTNLALENQLLDSEAPFSLPSASDLLLTLLSTLAKLCAPARDEFVSRLISSLPSSSITSFVDTCQSLILLCTYMKSDLTTFRRTLVGTLNDEESLKEVVRVEARKRERMAVLEVVGGEDEVVRKTKAWLGNESDVNEENVARAMVESLFKDEAVSFSPSPSTATMPPTTSTNALPPIFYLSSPDLFHLQNSIQVLVVLSCLIVLSAPSSSPDPELINRLFIILTSATSPNDDTKLANLSAKLVASMKVDGEEKKKVESGVERILRYEDPVFKLLKGRCRAALESSLLRSLVPSSSSDENVIPIMRTGRSTGPKGENESTKPKRKELPPIRGFDKPALKELLEILAESIEREFGWCKEVWRETLGWSRTQS